MGVTLTNEMIKGAQQAQNKYGVPASVTLGQIMLESGGKYPGGLSGLAYKDNNLFGIKAGSSWKGQTSTYSTTEYVNGQYVKTNANFRKYNNVAQSIDDHGKLLNSSIYTNKTNSATNLNDYVNKMGSVYATDPNYSNKLMSIINSNNLTQYDNGSLPKGSTSTSKSSVPSSSNKTGNKGSTGSSGSESVIVYSSGSTGSAVVSSGSESEELSIIGTILKYIAILLLAIISVVFMLKGLQIELI